MRKNKWMHASVQKNTHATIDTIARVLARCYCEVRRCWCGHYCWIGHQTVSRVACYYYKDHQRWQRWSLKLFLDHLICHTHQSILKISWDHPTNILRLWDIWEHYQGGRFGKLVHFLFQFDFSLQNKIWVWCLAGGFHLTSALAFLNRGEERWSDGGYKILRPIWWNCKWR